MAEKKKILYIVEAMGGGVFTYIVDLANELVNSYDMYIAYAVRKQTPGNYKDYFDKRIHLIEVKNFGRAIDPAKDIAAFFEVKKIVAEIKPDVIHLHSSKAGAIGRVAFNGKIPMFYTPHGYSFLMENYKPMKRRMFKLIESVCAKRNCTTISCSVGEHSSVLVGSDQLWLPGNIAADYYTLNFVPETVNSIAYATSFGQSSLPKDSTKKAELFLKKIKHIGVREESGQKLVKEIADRNVPVVCDPTLLFTGDEWMSIQKKEPIVEGKYILCYFLGNNPPHREFAKRLKEATGCKIIALTHLDEFVKSDEGYADETPYDIDPADFLNLIRNAEYVCTDSFHCSVFSILYKRQFFTFRRYNRNTKQSTNSRLDTLFNMAGITGRLLTGEENIVDCLKIETDFESVHKKLEGIRQKSYEYLLAALKDEGSTDL